MNEPDLQARRRRRFTLPVLTVVLAAGVWWWSAKIEPQRDAEVLALAERLRAEAAPPRPSTAPIGATEPIIVDLVREALGRYASDGTPPTLQVRRGDVEGKDGRATHHVLVEDQNGRWIVLRVAHPGDPAKIIVIGVEASGE